MTKTPCQPLRPLEVLSIYEAHGRQLDITERYIGEERDLGTASELGAEMLADYEETTTRGRALWRALQEQIDDCTAAGVLNQFLTWCVTNPTQAESLCELRESIIRLDGLYSSKLVSRIAHWGLPRPDLEKIYHG